MNIKDFQNKKVKKGVKRQIEASVTSKAKAPLCAVFEPHPKNVARGREVAEGISGLENFFKALSDATRLKILFALYDAGELCVCDLGEIAGVSLASASHHIRLLFQAGLVRYEKRGKFVYYALDDSHVFTLLEQALVHCRHKEGENCGSKL